MSTSIQNALVLALVHFLIWGPSSRSNAVENFFVKAATYSDGSGYFRCEAKIPANDSATLTITTDKADADRIVEVLNTSHAAAVTVSTVGAGNDEKKVITVTIRSAKAVDASISYTTCATGVPCSRDAFSLHYELDSAALTDKAVPGKLNAFARVKDASKSNAKWFAAQLDIQRGALGSLAFKDIDMDVGNTIVLPVDELKDYPVEVAKLNSTVTLGSDLYDQVRLTNKGDKVLQKGEIRWMQDGFYSFTTRLTKDLKKNEFEDLPAGKTDKVSVSFGTEKKIKWYKAVALGRDGKLKYLPWTVQSIHLKNNTNQMLRIVHGQGEPWILQPNSELSREIGVPMDGEQEATLNDFNATKANLEGLAALKQYRDSRLEQLVTSIRENLRLVEREASVKVNVTNAQSMLFELTKSGAPGFELDDLRFELQRWQDESIAAEVNGAVAKREIAKTLNSLITTDLETAKKVDQSQPHFITCSSLGSGTELSVAQIQGR